MLVQFEGVGGSEQHHARKHVPLDFEPAVGAFAEEISARRIARADQAGQQNKQFATMAIRALTQSMTRLSPNRTDMLPPCRPACTLKIDPPEFQHFRPTA
jgi:hypothetical protein